jgi:hypothetical protein
MLDYKYITSTISTCQMGLFMVVSSVATHWSYLIGVHSLNVRTCTMFCIWPDDGSMSRNMSPNF